MKRKRGVDCHNLVSDEDETQLSKHYDDAIKSHASLSTFKYLIRVDFEVNPEFPFLFRRYNGYGTTSCAVISSFDRLLDLVLCGNPFHALEIVHSVVCMISKKYEFQAKKRSDLFRNEISSNMQYRINSNDKTSCVQEWMEDTYMCLKNSISYSFFRLLSVSSPKPDNNRDERIFRAVYLFTSAFPELKSHLSSSGNTPLHLALLHNGHSEKLIRLLLDFENERIAHSILTRKNKSGKLPIHVAVCTGVPMYVLRLVVAESIKAFPSSSSQKINKDPFQYIYTNIAHIEDENGMNAFEMAWVRRLNPNFRRFKERARNSRKTNLTFTSLFKEAIEQVEMEYKTCIKNFATADRIDSSTSVNNSNTMTDSSKVYLKEQTIADKILGSFWSNTLLLLRGTHYGTISDPLPGGHKWRMVHAASALWSCPLGILKVTILLHPEQIQEKDENGMLPLHLAIHCYTNTIPSNRLLDFYEKVEFLITSYRGAAHISNKYDELPLHMILKCLKKKKIWEESVWGRLVKIIARAYPEAVDVIDPVSGLYPFMHAAISISECNPNDQCKNNNYDALNATYHLLRLSPTCVQIGIPRKERIQF